MWNQYFCVQCICHWGMWNVYFCVQCVPLRDVTCVFLCAVHASEKCDLCISVCSLCHWERWHVYFCLQYVPLRQVNVYFCLQYMPLRQVKWQNKHARLWRRTTWLTGLTSFRKYQRSELSWQDVSRLLVAKIIITYICSLCLYYNSPSSSSSPLSSSSSFGEEKRTWQHSIIWYSAMHTIQNGSGWGETCWLECEMWLSLTRIPYTCTL